MENRYSKDGTLSSVTNKNLLFIQGKAPIEDIEAMEVTCTIEPKVKFTDGYGYARREVIVTVNGKRVKSIRLSTEEAVFKTAEKTGSSVLILDERACLLIKKIEDAANEAFKKILPDEAPISMMARKGEKRKVADDKGSEVYETDMFSSKISFVEEGEMAGLINIPIYTVDPRRHMLSTEPMPARKYSNLLEDAAEQYQKDTADKNIKFAKNLINLMYGKYDRSLKKIVPAPETFDELETDRRFMPIKKGNFKDATAGFKPVFAVMGLSGTINTKKGKSSLSLYTNSIYADESGTVDDEYAAAFEDVDDETHEDEGDI